MRQLFALGEDVWDSIDYKSIVDTVKALEEAELSQMPFPEFDIQGTVTRHALSQVFADVPEDTKSKTYTFRYKMVEGVKTPVFTFKVGDKFLYVNELMEALKGRGVDEKMAFDQISMMGSFFAQTLLALLATKNAEKVTEKIKKHGPKSRKRPREYDYITTIKIGKITETMRSEGDGSATVRPHLRRGHIRNQRVGKGREEIKPIFIQPVFVNADEGWIANQRKEYKLAA